jgi:catechol 2,3-dioxygenase-like lactoylglutathione lyase family enzyme
MMNALTQSQIFVLDQDQALDFYVGKLGLEVADDVDLGFMRWLTVQLPGHPERKILLERPGSPAADLHHRRCPGHPRRPQGQGCRHHRRTHRAPVRHRLRHP